MLASLPPNSRVLVLPADALVRGNVDVLLSLDLGDGAIAAREDVRRNRQNLATLVRRVSARQGLDWQAALKLLAVGYPRVGNGNVAFDPRVAVMASAALTKASWSDLAGPLIAVYGASWAEALNIVLAGQNRPLGTESVGNVALEGVEAGAPVLIGFAQSRLAPGLFTAA